MKKKLEAIEMTTLSQGPSGKIAPGKILPIVKTPATIFEVTMQQAERLISCGSAKPARIKTKETATITTPENALDPGAGDGGPGFDFETSDDLKGIIAFADGLDIEIPQQPNIDDLRDLIREKQIDGLRGRICDDLDKLTEYAATLDIKVPTNATVAGLRKLIEEKQAEIEDKKNQEPLDYKTCNNFFQLAAYAKKLNIDVPNGISVKKLRKLIAQKLNNS